MIAALAVELAILAWTHNVFVGGKPVVDLMDNTGMASTVLLSWVANMGSTAAAAAIQTSQAPPRVAPTPAPANATSAPGAAKPSTAPAVPLGRSVDLIALAAQPEAFFGQRVIVEGEASSINHEQASGSPPSTSTIIFNARHSGSTITAATLLVTITPDDPRITADVCYRVMGSVIGTGDLVYQPGGAHSRVPAIHAEAWEKVLLTGTDCAATD